MKKAKAKYITRRGTPRKRGIRRRRLKFRPPTKAEIKKRIQAAFTSRFGAICFYLGFDLGTDRVLEKAAKQRSVGSGFDISCGLRDIEFQFKTRAHMLACVKRIKATKIKGVTVMISETWKA